MVCHTVAVIGLAAANSTATSGAGRTIAIDSVGSKHDLAKRFGATDVVDGSRGDLVEVVRAVTGAGVHFRSG